MFDCQHGKDRKAGEKRKRKDAEEVNEILHSTYIYFSYPRYWFYYCHLWHDNTKVETHITGSYDIYLRILL